jgi:hypothetical protein
MILNFWGIYEKDFPERPYVKAPKDSDFSFGALFAWRPKKVTFPFVKKS